MIHVDKIASLVGAPIGTSPYSSYLIPFGLMKKLTYLPVRHRAIQEFRKPQWFHTSQQTRCWIPIILYSSLGCIRFGLIQYLMAWAMSFIGYWVSPDQGGNAFFGMEEHGILGYRTSGTQAGDTVCIVAGATTPFCDETR